MTEEIVGQPFAEAEEKVEAAHREAAAQLKEKVSKAKAAALKKVAQ